MSTRDAVRANLNALDMMPCCPRCNDLNALGAKVCAVCGTPLVKEKQ